MAQGNCRGLIEEVLKEEWRKTVEISDQKWKIRNRRSAGGQPTANRQLTQRSADHQAVIITVRDISLRVVRSTGGQLAASRRCNFG